HVLGKTPLTLALDAEWTSDRNFELSLNGFATYALRQPPSSKDVRVMAQLVPVLGSPPEEQPEQPAQPTQPSKKRRVRAHPTKSTPAQPQPQPHEEPDIRLQR